MQTNFSLSNNNISIILVEPQMGENIGASARAMKNFAISDLRIINPRDGWPNDKAVNMSVGAIDLIKAAKIYGSVPDAIKDLDYVYAAVAASRNINKKYVLSRNLKSDIIASNKIGIMFGRESSGLNNQEIAYANKIVTIGTNKDFSSLNIAHSVAVICYELFHAKNQVRKDSSSVREHATHEDLGYFYDHLFKALEQKAFFRTKDKKEHMTIKIRNLFNRIDNLSKQEIQTLRGIITTLTNK